MAAVASLAWQGLGTTQALAEPAVSKSGPHLPAGVGEPGGDELRKPGQLKSPGAFGVLGDVMGVTGTKSINGAGAHTPWGVFTR